MTPLGVRSSREAFGAHGDAVTRLVRHARLEDFWSVKRCFDAIANVLGGKTMYVMTRERKTGEMPVHFMFVERPQGSGPTVFLEVEARRVWIATALEVAKRCPAAPGKLIGQEA